MWTWQLALLALVALLAPPAASAPKPAITGSLSPGAPLNHQFSTFNPHNEPYNQWTYPYNLVQYNGVYSNIYSYNDGSNYYGPPVYYNPDIVQANNFATKTHRPLKANFAEKPGFVQKDPNHHGQKLSTLLGGLVHNAKESAEKDLMESNFGFHTKKTFPKTDVFGPDHEQTFNGGKQVFSGGQVLGPRPDELSNLRLADVGKGPGSDPDSYGFYSDLSNLYSEKSFDGKQSVDKTFSQRQPPKQSPSSPFAPAFSVGPGLASGPVVGGTDRQPALPAAGSSDDSYGYYSDLSKLYGDTPWKQPGSTAGLDATSASKDSDANVSENHVNFGNQPESAVDLFRQDISPNDTGFDSYEHYSDLDNLYRTEKQKTSFKGKQSAAKNKKTASGLDRTNSFGEFNTEISTVGLDFNSRKVRPGDKLDQKSSPNDAGFDSYGFYSDLDNLYHEDSPKGIHDNSVTRGLLQLNAAPTRHQVSDKTPVNPASRFQTAPSRGRGSQVGGLGSLRHGELDAARSQKEVDFDSYGFYSDPRNLYT